MDWSNKLNKMPYLVLFAMLISTGMTGAYALTVTLDGDLISYLGILDMNTNKITNVGDPTLPSDAATKAYVDSSSGVDTLALLSCTTDQVPSWDGLNWVCSNPNFEPNETLDMNTNKITNVGDPTLPSDAATKAYVDSSQSFDILLTLSCSAGEVPKWNKTQWECSEI